MSALHAAVRDCDAFPSPRRWRGPPRAARIPRPPSRRCSRCLTAATRSRPRPPHTAAAGAGAGAGDAAGALAASGAIVKKVGGKDDKRPPTLEELDASPLAARHGLFIDLYVNSVRPLVVQAVCHELAAERDLARRGTVIGRGGGTTTPCSQIHEGHLGQGRRGPGDHGTAHQRHLVHTGFPHVLAGCFCTTSTERTSRSARASCLGIDCPCTSCDVYVPVSSHRGAHNIAPLS